MDMTDNERYVDYNKDLRTFGISICASRVAGSEDADSTKHREVNHRLRLANYSALQNLSTNRKR